MDDIDDMDLDLIDQLLEQERTKNQQNSKSTSFETNINWNEDTRSTLNTRENSNSLNSFYFSKSKIPSKNLEAQPKPTKFNEIPKQLPALSDVSFLNFKTQNSNPTNMKKEIQDKNKNKKQPLLHGQQRLTEYVRQADSIEKAQIALAKMTPEEIKNHYKNYQTSIGKNSGLEPKLSFDQAAIKSWAYLLTKGFREYQFKIVETCLFHNTLVCLPTGLGKTFIAANVMLNFYRWFPLGKIFFLAPTKPLVTQQKDAIECLNSIDTGDIIEITGSVTQKKRQKYYYEKRMFFMTPQTLENDIEKGVVLPEDICLIIFDEAHKALGKYAYTNIVKAVDKGGIGYRIVALTATPGNNEEKIQEVLDNLHISRLEVKDENDPDVKPYVQNKHITEITIKDTNMMATVTNLLNQILMKPIECLNKMNIFKDEKFAIKKPHEINHTKIMQILNEFKANEQELTLQIGQENKSIFFEIISIIKSISQAKKTLQEQGIMSFIKVFDNFKTTHKNKYGYAMEYKKRLLNYPEFKSLEKAIDVAAQSGGHHPKLEKLLQILVDFFNEKSTVENNSKCMIFTNNRASASEIDDYLKKNDKIMSSIFVGQSSHKGKDNQVIEGLNQKQQIEIIEKFKENKLNTLIATCIGEEGLDIGEIDLIICYDSGFSPIRMVQRMGRTGRKREGRVLVLLMEGREFYNYRNSVKKSQNLKNGLKANSNDSKKSNLKKKNPLRFYSFNSRMIPDDTVPKLIMINDINEEKLKELKERDEGAEILETAINNLANLEDDKLEDFNQDDAIIEEDLDDEQLAADMIEFLGDDLDGVESNPVKEFENSNKFEERKKSVDDDDDDLYDNLSEIFENEKKREEEESKTLGFDLIEDSPRVFNAMNSNKSSFFKIEQPNTLKRKFGDGRNELDDLYSGKKIKVNEVLKPQYREEGFSQESL